MKKLDVSHFLAIYSIRKRMQESGVTKVTTEVKQFTKDFVEKLSHMPPDEEIKVKDGSFLDSKGNMIARLPVLKK